MIRIDNREFVVTYLRSESVDEAAKSLAITRQQVIAKATYLRKMGVKLPKMGRVTNRSLEIAQLNSLINKHLKESRR